LYDVDAVRVLACHNNSNSNDLYRLSESKTKQAVNQQPTTSLSNHIPMTKSISFNPLPLSLAKKARKIRQAIQQQKRGDPHIPPNKGIPRPYIHKRIPTHRAGGQPDMARVRHGDTGEVSAQDLGLGGGVADGDTEEEEEAVEIAELVGEGNAAGVDGGGAGGVWGLLVYEVGEVGVGEGPAGDSGELVSLDDRGRMRGGTYRVIGSIMAKTMCGQVGRMVDILMLLV
jgi:hypothetical protein